MSNEFGAFFFNPTCKQGDHDSIATKDPFYLRKFFFPPVGGIFPIKLPGSEAAAPFIPDRCSVAYRENE